MLSFGPAPLYLIFRQEVINGTILGGKKITEHKVRGFIFSTTVMWL
jgi:hypothetical protein